MVLVATLLVACTVTPKFPDSGHVTLESIEPLATAGLVVLQFSLKNDSDAVMPVAGMSYRLYFNGAEFAYGISRQSVDVPARGEAVFDVTVPGMLPTTTPDSNAPPGLNYRLTGRINLIDNPEMLPFDARGNLTWQDAPDP